MGKWWSQLQRKGDTAGASLQGSPAQLWWDKDPLSMEELHLGGEAELTLWAERDPLSGTK